MKSIVLICLLGFSTLFSCEAQKDDSKFKVYIDNFEKIDLPFSINQDRLETLIEPNSSSIDSSSIDFFIEKNKDMGGGVFLFDLYYYNPLGYFKIKEKNTAVIIEKNGGAGGIEKHIYLIIYNENGAQLDKLLISKAVGDCSFMKIRTSEIDRGFKISIKDISFLGNCDDETFIKKDSSKTIYDINNGRIKEI